MKKTENNKAYSNSSNLKAFRSAFIFFIATTLVGSLTLSPSVSFAQSQSESKISKKQSIKKTSRQKRRKKFLNKRNKSAPTEKKRNYKNQKLLSAKVSLQKTATIESARNKVQIKKSGQKNWTKASRKAKVGKSDEIKTGRRSIARVRLEDGSKLLLLQNSRAQLENLSTVKKTIKLFRGRVRAIVQRLKKARSFRIETPIGVASVRGTEFEVEYLEDSDEMLVDVIKGRVGVSRLGDLADEVVLNPGDRVRFGKNSDILNPIRTGSIPINSQRSEIRAEVRITQAKDQMMALAAEESRNADYQVGKSLIDVDGTRVRVEEYIVRPAANQFKLVALNERATRFDYFTYLGTFNTTLPEDLSIALSEVNGKFGTTAPTYFLKEYEMKMSNTVDIISDVGLDGHLVKIDFDGTNYTLTDPTDGSNTKVVVAAELQGDGSYKIYNPVKDKFSLVSAANLAEAQKISIVDSGNYRDMASGDTVWRTRFNENIFTINGTEKSSFVRTDTSKHSLAIDLDVTFSNPPITAISEFPSGTGALHNKLSLYYGDGSKVTYESYIIDDEGNIADTNAFSGISTSAAYQNQLVNFNFQQKISSDEMSGRDINLVIDPRIGTISGLIQ